MHLTSETLETLVEQFSKLPTVGRKTAQRLAAYILKMPREEVVELADALVAVKDRVTACSVCYNVTDDDPCPICLSAKRDRTVICVVEEPNDVLALERTGEYHGQYHVLGGVISPLDGIGPDDLKIRELVARIADNSADNSANNGASDSASQAGGDGSAALTTGSAVEDQEERVTEVILAMNPNVEGDTTAYYIGQLLGPLGVQVTRIARGLPVGGDLEYADEATLSRALEGRAGM